MRRQGKRLFAPTLPLSDVTKRRAFQVRIEVIFGILLLFLLIIIARLIELQIIRGKEYEDVARAQHYGGIELPAKRGEIFSRNSKTGELNLLATNTTLDLLYVDPFVTSDKHHVSTLLAETLITKEIDGLCRSGNQECPRELREYYADAFNPLLKTVTPVSPVIASEITVQELPSPTPSAQIISPYEEIVRKFAASIEDRIQQEFINFVPLLYGGTKSQLQQIQEFGIPGIFAIEAQQLIYANPLQIPDYERQRVARIVAPVLGLDPVAVRDLLARRRLRYVPIMRKISPETSKYIRKLKEESSVNTVAERIQVQKTSGKEVADRIVDPLRGIALIPEHWRYYPDETVASQIVGFVREPPPGLSLIVKQQPQNGIERVFDHELRGQHGEINTVIDPFGGQIFSEEQTIKQAEDGRSVVLTIDRYLQKQVEKILQKAVDDYEADSGQVLIMEPSTGQIVVMANAPLFDGNNYSGVYEKVQFDMKPEDEPKIVVEIYHPQTNVLVIRGYLNDLTPEGRARLSRDLQQQIGETEKLFDLEELKRYYYFLGENNRIELFPICPDGKSPTTTFRTLSTGSGETLSIIPTGCTWLRYKNRIGVGAYVNKAVQEIYEPGSVFKPITMAIAIDQGEIAPEDTYVDTGSVEIDEYVIKNAGDHVFGELTMTDCLSFSVNTCMTSVSRKLGKKLFENYIRRFGFGKITGLQLEDEKSGNILDWRRWSDALLATAAYGQGISATPIQVVTALGALANGGKLMKPTIIDSWIDPDGTVHPVHPQILEQVVTEQAADTVTAMLVRGVEEGYAKRAKVEGYLIAGKTGTSQIALPGGGYEETGSGSFIATFSGYAPVDNPKFVMLIKFDRPRTEDYGAVTASPLFREIAVMLFDYYGIPPNENIK